MIKKQALRVCLGVLVILSLAAVAQAEVYKLAFYVFTSRAPNQPNQICFDVRVADTNFRGPDAIKSLKVLAPDGTTIDLTNNFWHEWMDGFWANLPATAFNSITIPPGKYTCTLIDKLDRLKTASVTLTPTYLNTVTITSPTPGQETSMTPTFTWNPVTGAQHYRIRLFNETWKEPVYAPHLDARSVVHVYQTRFIVPKGALRPGCTYSLQIEARDSDKVLTKRSRSVWVSFSTPPLP